MYALWPLGLLTHSGDLHEVTNPEPSRSPYVAKVGKRLLAIVAVVAVSGCGSGSVGYAASTAIRACVLVEPDLVAAAGVRIPTDAELTGRVERSTRAADLAAKAAVLDPRWKDLAEAQSAFADASTNAVILWSRIRAVSTVAYYEDMDGLQQLMYQAGITDLDLARAGRDLDVASRHVRRGCRPVRSAVAGAD